MEVWTEILQGDCLDILQQLPEECVDLHHTSPPYADARKSTYGGVPPEEYVKWFMPRADEMLRTLKPSGSLILNIKERVTDGERDTYVMELVLEMRRHGWLWIEEYSWCKKNCMPGRWRTRFRDAFERCHHFAKTKQFSMYQEAVMVPAAPNTIKRAQHLSERDRVCQEAGTGSPFRRSMAACTQREMVYPSNVLHLATETTNKGHSAVFPKALPEWFIKLFTKEGDVVCDPFCGSGTTCITARELGRHSFGIEINEEYYQLAKSR